MKLLEILKFSEEYLKKYSFSKPRLESEKIIADVLNLDRITLYAYFDRILTDEQKSKIKECLKIMARKRISFDEVKEKNIKKNIEIDYTDKNKQLLLKSIDYLEANKVKNSRLDVEYIFSYVLNVKKSLLTLNLKRQIDEIEKDKIRKLLYKRAKKRIPLQYLLGEWEFYGLPFLVDERVLIPRPDTEILVEQCKYILNDMVSPKILDIGTGSGAISISLAKAFPMANILGADISLDALEVAVKNRELNNIDKNLKFIKSDIFSKIKDKEYDMIISNPPYISKNEYEELMPEVRIHEPQNALTDNEDGYSFYKKISKTAGKYLKPRGYLIFEIGYNQAEKVSDFMMENSFDIVDIVKDYGGINRVIIGRKRDEKNVNEISGL